MDKKVIYEVSTNDDLTEGRGGKVHIAYCENKFTALRLSRGIGVQGSDGYIDEVTAVYFDKQWYVPVFWRQQNEQDIAEQALANKIELALEKASKAGLSQEEIQLLSQRKT